jgi:DNA-binding response OmpR family regulator
MADNAEPARILVVEDEFLVAIDVEDAVRRMGCQVLGPVASLEDALRLAEQEPIDGALLDVHLQHGLRVFPVADVLTRRNIPFCFMSAYRAEEIESGYADWPLLRKPFDHTALEAAIAQLLSQGRFASA